MLLQLVDPLIITLYYQVFIAKLFFFIFSLAEYILFIPDTQGSISSSSSLGEASNNFADHSSQPFNPSNPAIDYASSYNTDPYSAAVAAAVYSQLDGHHYGSNYHSPNQSSFNNNNYTGHLHGHHQNKSSSQRHNPYSRTSTNSSTSANSNSAGSNASNGSSSSSSAAHNDNVNATAAAILSAYSSAANTANSYPAALYYPYYSAHYLHHQNVVSNYTPPSIVDINSNLTSQK